VTVKAITSYLRDRSRTANYSPTQSGTSTATGGCELIIRKARMLPSHPGRYWPTAREC